MEQTSLSFIHGLILIIVVSFVFKHVFSAWFYISLPQELKDKFSTENEPTDEEIKGVTGKSMMLATLSYIAGLSFFWNSAILFALLLWRQL